MRKFLLLIMALGFHSQSKAAEGYVAGAGKQVCQHLQAELKQESMTTTEFQQWLLGYFSGANVAYSQRSRRGDVTTGATVLPVKLAELVLSKCSQNPVQPVSKAADEVYSELRQSNQ